MYQKPLKFSNKRRYLLVVFLFVLIISSLPLFYILSIKHQQESVPEKIKPSEPVADQFPITVDPYNKIIVEKDEVNNYLEGTSSPMAASVSGIFDSVWETLKSAVTAIAEAPWYQNIASVAGVRGQLVTINSGMRKEQVAGVFAKSLGWSEKEKKQFTSITEDAYIPLPEGTYSPDTYYVTDQMTPADVQTLINKSFIENVATHYGTTTSKIVPMDQALNIASIIQRETIGNKDMRLISGIIWNRIFIGMRLQVDATLQYAKANTGKTKEWWPDVEPIDKYIKSPYNTYLHEGLPPTPIANPSVGAILAALNPIKTPCIYYFNDKKGKFHCSKTYSEHVDLIRQYY